MCDKFDIKAIFIISVSPVSFVFIISFFIKISLSTNVQNSAVFSHRTLYYFFTWRIKIFFTMMKNGSPSEKLKFWILAFETMANLWLLIEIFMNVCLFIYWSKKLIVYFSGPLLMSILIRLYEFLVCKRSECDIWMLVVIFMNCVDLLLA